MKDNNSSRVHVRPVRRDPPDLAKLAKALITLAQNEAKCEQEQQAAKAEHDATGEEAA